MNGIPIFLKNEQQYYDEELLFHITYKRRKYILALTTVLRCLKIAEDHFFTPEIHQTWWEKIENIYVDVCKNIPNSKVEEFQDLQGGTIENGLLIKNGVVIKDGGDLWAEEGIFFIVQTKQEKAFEFKIGFFKIIECLGLAEKKEYIPQLPRPFWEQINGRYELYVPCKPYMFEPYDNPYVTK